jgi:positive regulator of sigma E activity
MEVSARVLAAEAGVLRLACEVTARCTACTGSQGCGQRLVRPGTLATLTLPGAAARGALLDPGEDVTVAVQDGELLRAVLVTFGPMVAGLLAGALAGHWFAGPGDTGVAAGALAGALAGFGLARQAARRWVPSVAVRQGPGGPAG